jgi:hypothetical protein
VLAYLEQNYIDRCIALAEFNGFKNKERNSVGRTGVPGIESPPNKSCDKDAGNCFV